MKLRVVLYFTYENHPELVEIVERASKEILDLTRKEDKGLAVCNRPPGGEYMNLSTTDNALQIVFHNPTKETYFYAGISHIGGGVVGIDGGGNILMQSDQYYELLEENKSLLCKLRQEELKSLGHRQEIKIQKNTIIRNMPDNELEAIMEKMTERQRVIIKERILREKPMTLRKLSKIVGLSGERIRQLQIRIIDHYF